MTRNEIDDLAYAAYDNIRTINHQTYTAAHPAPVVYDALGSLKLLGPALDQALRQIGAGLVRSLDVYDVREEDGGDPVARVAEAVDRLTAARAHADQMSDLIAAARVAIAHQRYRDHEPTEEAEAPAHDDPDDPLACMRCRVGAPLPHRRNDPACQEYRGA